MTKPICNVCQTPLEEKIYEASSSQSLTSMSIPANNSTEVFFCHHCQHVQTAEYGNELNYYDTSYNILSDSAEEDQIYIVQNDMPIYRTDHQVRTLLSKIDFFEGIQILDYGCAKSSTMQKLMKEYTQAQVYLYDISANYIPFWQNFLTPSNWATHEIPTSWQAKFDLVTSFFSLEHISNLTDVIQKVKFCLKPGGIFYAIVPNFLTNIADMIVVDHPNHFTDASLKKLLTQHGFKMKSIDSDSHRGALVFMAELSPASIDSDTPTKPYEKALEIAKFWHQSSEKIAAFENKNQGPAAAIYGAGFYGAFLCAHLKNINSIQFIIDQNPFLQGKTIFGRNVIRPDQLPSDIEVIYVGLNPMYAKNIIESIPVLQSPPRKYFYL